MKNYAQIKIYTISTTIDQVDLPELEVSVAENSENQVINDFRLSANYPNPFNATTVIQFEVPKNSHVKLEVYNLLGQKVKTLFSENFEKGVYTTSWHGNSDAGNPVSSGIYLYRMKANDKVLNKFHDYRFFKLINL